MSDTDDAIRTAIERLRAASPHAWTEARYQVWRDALAAAVHDGDSDVVDEATSQLIATWSSSAAFSIGRWIDLYHARRRAKRAFEVPPPSDDGPVASLEQMRDALRKGRDDAGR